MKGIIYKITNKADGRVYIGQTVQLLSRRWLKHKVELRHGKHHNRFLQRAYDKYGEDAFSIEVIEYCAEKDLDTLEREWIKHYSANDRDKGYNLESGGNEKKHHDQETIELLVLTHRCRNNKLTPEQVIEIKKAIISGDTIREIAKKYGVTDHCIHRIKKLQNWAYVAPEMNEAVLNTDTSRKVKRLTEEQYEECRSRLLNGESAFWVAQEYEIPYRRFAAIFREEIDKVRESDKDAKILAKKLFFENKSIAEILETTGLTYVQYKRVTAGLVEERREKNIKYVGKARSEGKSCPEIAKELNVNRCTITVYWKEYLRRYANTVISQ